MTPSDLALFREIIGNRLAEITTEIEGGEQATHTVELDQQKVGRLSRMDAIQQQAMAKAIETRRNSEALRLKAALARIEEGEFGYCEDCGELIPLARLKIDPATLRCVSCASG